jgi:hypothetical protein
MNHVKAIIVKFLMVTVMLLLVLGLFYGVDIGEILTISTIVTLVAYAIGDLFILPRFGNVVATIADFVLAYVVIRMLGAGIIDENIPLTTATLWSSVLIAVGEWFYHKYVIRVIRHDERKDDYLAADIQTEFAEESNTESLVEQKRKKEREKQ